MPEMPEATKPPKLPLHPALGGKPRPKIARPAYMNDVAPIEIKPDLTGAAWQELPRVGPFKDYDFVARENVRRLQVLMSHGWKDFNGQKQLWLHVSVSQVSRLPTYEELTEVKRRFIGEGRKAVMVFPEADMHVNDHDRCLHLFCCLSTDPLPEFSIVVDGKRRL